jgi:SAM-dependent methyltransferase
VVDLGCGGGIYTRALRALGARQVLGVDGSSPYIDEARASTDDLDVEFVFGDAGATGLASGAADLVFSRALIHHLDSAALKANAQEMARLLSADGRIAVQDRTVEDVQAKDPEFWIRATLFDVFPQLMDFETRRRPDTEDYCSVLDAAGFESVRICRFAETRRTYTSFNELASEILARKGKSILFELTDSELGTYCDALRERCPSGDIHEQDRWTLWLASKMS